MGLLLNSSVFPAGTASAMLVLTSRTVTNSNVSFCMVFLRKAKLVIDIVERVLIIVNDLRWPTLLYFFLTD
jgi:hypothetical protein